MTRTDVLNELAKKHNLKRYLEIGVQNPAQNFDKVICEYKIGVDPDKEAHATFRKTSDEFFNNLDFVDNNMGVRVYYGYDLIFIDGYHEYKQAKRDLENSMRVLDPKGFIVLHDVNPLDEVGTYVPRKTSQWWGDVYKLAASIQNEKWTIDDEQGGCMVIPYTKKLEYGDIPTWHDFVSYRAKYLNL